MALEYNFPDHMHSPESDTENESVEQRGSPSDTATGSACNSSNAFDCNICLEFVQDRVVTLCGHLYCWPCIYKWIHFSNISNEDSDQQPLCPVCKAEVSVASVVPLYSRGKDIKCSEREATDFGLSIPLPERPSAPICWDMWAVSARQLHLNNYEPPPAEPHQPHYIPDATSSVPRLGGTSAFQPIIEIFGEMVCAMMFGQSITNAYNHSNSYSMAGAYIPRVRRQLMHADQSLSRLCFFLVCCMVLCLLLF